MSQNPQQPKYRLIVQREKEYHNVKAIGSGARVKPDEEATISSVRLENESGEAIFKCFCCENGGESTDTPKQDKRVVARKYKLNWSSSGVNGGCARTFTQWQVKNPACPIKITDGTQGANVVIWLTTSELPSFAKRRIHIHSGSCPQHTEGCLLFAYTDNKNGTVSNSAKCINDFFTLANKIGLENIILEIKEIPQN